MAYAKKNGLNPGTMDACHLLPVASLSRGRLLGNRSADDRWDSSWATGSTEVWLRFRD